MYTHILIPTDGSEFAQRGADHALALARALGSRVTILTVTEPFERIYARGWVPSEEDIKRYDEQNDAMATELLTKIKTQAENMGVACETVHERNTSAASAIVDAAQRLGCNLIVMASHGRRSIERMLLGSQTSEVLANSTIPVLVVR